MTYFTRSSLQLRAFVIVALGLCSAIACSDTNNLRQIEVEVPLMGMASNIEVSADELTTEEFTFELPDNAGQVASMRIDLEVALAGMEFTPAGPSLQPRGLPTPTQAFARIAPMNQPDVCTNGILYGPYQVMHDGSSQPSSIDQSSQSMNQDTLKIINSGGLAICLGITSPFNGSFDIDSVGVDLEVGPPCEEDPENFAGTWSGTFTCDDSCSGESDPEQITLMVTQDGDEASYADGIATYTGTICGNKFRFSGTGPDFSESGTLTIKPDGSARKTSSYYDLFGGPCRGDCVDELTRVVP